MAGFDNQVMFANNVDFTGSSSPSAQVLSNGQLLIGSSIAPNIRVNNLTSHDGTVTISNGNGTIDLSASSGIVNPSPNFSTFVMWDDFLSLQVSSSGGQLGWLNNTNTNSTTITTDNKHPGITTNNALAAGQAYWILRTSHQNNFILGNVAITYNTVVKIGTLSDITNTYTVIAGIQNDVSSTPTDGIYFSYTNGTNSGHWTINCTSSSSTTSADTGIAVQTTNFVNLGITVNAAATAVHFFINGVETANSPITTNIPSAAITPSYSITRSAGTVADSSFQIDLFYMKYVLGTSRATG